MLQNDTFSGLNSAWFTTALLLTASSLSAALPTPEAVFFDVPEALISAPIPDASAQLLAVPGYPNDPLRLTLLGLWALPDPVEYGAGPYPTIIVLHGSGGLWSNDIIANGTSNQFDDWLEVLPARGYAVLFIDSFNPRGIAGNFAGKFPSYDPADDDALCSSNYERPKDVIAGLTFLTTRPEESDLAHIGLLGFSHGSQTGLNAILDPSVDLSPYTVDYVDLVLEDPEEEDPELQVWVETDIDLEVSDPVRISDPLPFPKVCAFYYPGGAHYGYHGQASSIAAGRYMPDRRTQVLMFHGTEDGLLGVSNPDDAPPTLLTGSLFPIKLVESSRLQAEAEGIPNPFAQHIIFNKAEHSFDGTTIENPEDWNTNAESVDEKSKRLARDEVLKWFDFLLKPSTLRIRPDDNDPDHLELAWEGHEQLRYQLNSSTTLESWAPLGDALIGSNTEETAEVIPIPMGKLFYTVEYEPVAPPIDEIENTGFFRAYSEFDL